MKNEDISSLSLADLFGTLKGFAENNAKSEAGRRASAPRKPKAQTLTPAPYVPIVFRTQWKDEALVLIVTRITCQCCGEETLAPSVRPLVRRTHPGVGTHCIAIDFPEQYSNLPREVEYREQRIPVCHHCFDLEDHIIHASQCANLCCKQQSLSLSFPGLENPDAEEH